MGDQTTESTTGILPVIAPVVDDIRIDLGIISFALILNLVSCFIHCGCKRGNKVTNFDRLVFGFNLTNTIGNFVFVPAVIYNVYATEDDSGMLVKREMCFVARSALGFVLIAANLILMTMIMERFALAWFPLSYTDNKTNDKRVGIIVSVMWMIAAGAALVPVSGYGRSPFHFIDNLCPVKDLGEMSKVYTFVLSFACIVSILVSAILYVLAAVKIIKIHRKFTNRRIATREDGDEIVSMIFLLFLWITATTCGLPLLVRSVMHWMTPQQHDYGSDDAMISKLATLNMVANPVIYLIFRKENLTRVKEFCASCQQKNTGIQLKRVNTL